MSIKQQAMIPADPPQVYAVLADAEALSALSGMPGAAGRSAGEEFSAFDGHVTGRQIELVPGERIVQAWRFPQWEPGTYSIVRFTLVAEAGGTRLVLEQRSARLAAMATQLLCQLHYATHLHHGYRFT